MRLDRALLMNRIFLAMTTSVVLLIVFVFLLAKPGDMPGSSLRQDDAQAAEEPLLVYCAASNRAVIEIICRDYERECGRSVQLQYGPSQSLLSSMEVSGTGDLFLPADELFIEAAVERRLVAEILPLATMKAVVAVRRDRPHRISSFADLLNSDLRFVQASPEVAAVGRVTRNVLEQSDLWRPLEESTAAFRTTVVDVANDIVVGAADAGIVYDAVLHGYPDLQAIELPELKQAVSQVSMAVISSTRRPQAALHFARYAAARDRGLLRYQEFGFQPAAGDVWSDQPELSLFAGSMLRPAIEDTIAQFEQREGVRVSRVYNGCGILVAQMKAGQHPDAYFACDKEFMQQVPDLFPQSVDVSQNELVILVQKGNPHDIRELKDLAGAGLRVGIGHEKQCAMGWLTQNTLRQGGVEQQVMKNVTVQSPTGDMLVNQLRAGSLDVAVAYLSNAAGSGDVLDAIRITGLSCSVATQPFGISPSTAYPQLTRRLFSGICSAESQAVFQEEGFRWQLPDASLQLP